VKGVIDKTISKKVEGMAPLQYFVKRLRIENTFPKTSKIQEDLMIGNIILNHLKRDSSEEHKLIMHQFMLR